MCLRRLGCSKEGVGERKVFKEKDPVSPINVGELKISLPLSLHPTVSVSFFFFLNSRSFIYFIYLFMTVLSLRFCARAFSSCGKWGPLFIAVRGPLTIAASLVAEHRLQTRRLSSCGARA